MAVLGAREAGEEPIYQPPLEIEDKVQRTVEIRVSEATREILQAYRLGYLSAPEGQLFETP
ncbi:hypothetical protein [Halomonas saccharevitans]|uniref:hypothetical protein n=1 Tax=Halomonas saccharevitans TaxID=416872 RepID=UPI00111332D6|nr:hypothetical protein [Halomonas saccharevitans]